MKSIVVVCHLVLTFQGNDWRTGQPVYQRGPDAPKCYSERDVVPEELMADDGTAKSMAATIDELVKKMEAPKP